MKHIMQSNMTAFGKLVALLPLVATVAWFGMRLASMVAELPLPK